jgi:hypothetical protein
MRPSLAVLPALVLALLPATASAAPPANDAPAAATVIAAAPAFVSGLTTEATLDADEPAPLVANDDDGRQHGLDRSVWFSYQPDVDRKLLVDTCDANFTSHIDVYGVAPSGDVAFVPAVSNAFRDCPGDRRSFAAKADTRYLIRVTAQRDGVRVPDGGSFHLKLTPQQPPINDAFADATPLMGTGTVTTPLAFSTLELGEPSYEDDTGSVWYRLAPTASQAFTATALRSPTEVTLQVFEARGQAMDRLRRLGADYTETDVDATVTFNALAGRVYYLRVGTSARVPAEAQLQLTTNTAEGLGLVVTPATTTIAELRRTGFSALLSCVRRCTLGVDLLVTPTDAKRYGLAKRKPRRPVRVGHVGGTLPAGVPTSVTVPLSATVRRRLAGARVVHLVLRATVRGGRNDPPSPPVSRVITLRT